MLEQLSQWLLSLAVEVFKAAWNFVSDAFVAVLDALLTGVVNLLASIPMCGALMSGLQPLYSALPSGTLYALNQIGLPEAFVAIGCAVMLRLSLRMATLFQWG